MKRLAMNVMLFLVVGGGLEVIGLMKLPVLFYIIVGVTIGVWLSSFACNDWAAWQRATKQLKAMDKRTFLFRCATQAGLSKEDERALRQQQYRWETENDYVLNSDVWVSTDELIRQALYIYLNKHKTETEKQTDRTLAEAGSLDNSGEG